MEEQKITVSLVLISITLLCLISGVVTLVMLLTIIQKRNRLINLLIWVLLFVTLGIIMIQLIGFDQLNPLFLQNGKSFLVLKLLYFLDGILLFFFPVFNHELLPVKHKKLWSIIWGVIAGANIGYMIYMVASDIPFTGTFLSYPFHYLLIDTMFVYILFVIIFSLRKIRDKEFKRQLAVYITGLSILLLMTFLDYTDLSPLMLFGKQRSEVQLIFQHYFWRNLFFFAANIFIIVLLTRHSTVKPFFLSSTPDEYLNQFTLTTREKEIVSYLIEGLTNKEIGQKLFISEFTVKTHVKNIYEKMKVKNRVELANKIKKHTEI